MKKLLILLFIICPLHAEIFSSENLMYSPNKSQVSLSPNGRWISFIELQTDKTTNLNIIDTHTLKVHSMLQLDEKSRFYNYEWLDNNHVLLRINNHKKKDFNLIANITEGEGDTKPPLIQKKVEAKGYLVSRLINDTKHILFAKETKGKTSLYKVPIESLYSNDFATYSPVEAGLKGADTYFYDDHKKQLFTVKLNLETESLAFFYKTLGTEKWLPFFTITDADYQFLPIGFINQHSVAVITNKNSDKSQVSIFDIRTQTITGILYAHPKYDIQSAELNSNGKLVSASYIQHGKYTTHYFEDEYSNLHNSIANALEGEQFFWVSSSLDGTLNLLFNHSATEPGKYYLYNAQNNKLELLFSISKMENVQYAKTTFFNFEANDGTSLEGYLTTPNHDDKKVLLVMPHGGPIGVRESDEFNPEVQYLASRGFSILQVNFRGSAGFGKDFLESGVGQFGNLIEQDISAAVAHVRSQNDYEHTCSIGSSYGGYSAVMLAIKHPDIYECVIASFGIYDLPLLYNASNYALTEDYREFVTRTVGEYSQDLQNISPVYQAKSLKAPILIIAGKQDDTSGFEQSNRFYYVLDKLGHDVEKAFFKYSGHGHNNWYYDQVEIALVSDFLQRKLKLKKVVQSNTESEREALKHDHILLADTFNSSRVDTSLKDKSFNYYKLAADFNHDRATFNVGSYYHRGQNTVIDINKAIDYYTRSANLGYINAQERLGFIYGVSQLVTPDYAKAAKHFKAVFDEEQSVINAFKLAMIHCIANDKTKDINKCFSLLNTYGDKVDTNTREDIRELLAIMMLEGEYSDAELLTLQTTLKTVFGLDFDTTEINIERSGLFQLVLSNKYNGRSEVEQLSKLDNFAYKLDSKQRFGVEFTLDRKGLDSRKDGLVVFTKWHFTPDDPNQNEYVYYQTLWGNPFSEWSTVRTLDETSVPGKWQLTIMGSNQAILHEKTFTVSAVN